MTGATLERGVLKELVKAIESVGDQRKSALCAEYGIVRFREEPDGDPVLEEIVREHMLAGGAGDDPAFLEKLRQRLVAMNLLPTEGGIQ